jgi:DNA repair ATPase RecN
VASRVNDRPAPKIELTKRRLESRKIELEIKDLERPFWKRPVYVLAGLPTVLAVVTLSVGVFNGYFSASLTKLENQKFAVEAEIKEFEVRRDTLHAENDRLKRENDSVEEKINSIEKRHDSQLVDLNAKRAQAQQAYDELENKYTALDKKFQELSPKARRGLGEASGLKY